MIEAADYRRWLIDEMGRTNGRQRAEGAGCARPLRIQRVRDRYAWDVDAVPTVEADYQPDLCSAHDLAALRWMTLLAFV